MSRLKPHVSKFKDGEFPIGEYLPHFLILKNLKYKTNLIGKMKKNWMKLIARQMKTQSP